MKIQEAIEKKLSEYNTENASEMIDVAVFGGAKAGAPSMVEYPHEYEKVDARLWTSGDFSVFKIRGDSMAPRFCDGDRVIVKKENEYDSGDIVLVFIDGGATLKELKKTRSGIELVPFNREYDIIRYPKEKMKKTDLKIIGRVVELRGTV